MNIADLVLGFAAGAAVGIATAWLVRGLREEKRLASQAADFQRRADEQAERINILTGQLHGHEAQAERVPVLEADLAKLRDENAELRVCLAQLKESLDAERRSIAAQKALLDQDRAALPNEFKALAADALKQNTDSFLKLAGERLDSAGQKLTVVEQAARAELEKSKMAAQGDREKHQQAIAELVKPLREQLARYEAQIRELEKSRNEAYGKVDEQLKALNDRTGRLDLALHNPQARGRWGEFQLRRVAELAGMIDRCDFEEQASASDDEGNRFRPDMIVRLPGGGLFIVDAKTPLNAYLDAAGESDPEARLAALARHAEAVMTHMKSLANKQYGAQLAKSMNAVTPDIVIMFLPGEHFLSAAVEACPDLMERGFDLHVIPATPATLVTLLRTAALAWRQEQLAENAERIHAQARELYERLATVGDYLADVGKSLEKSVKSYNQLVRSMETRVLVTARRIPELGVKGSAKSEEFFSEPVREIEAAPIVPSAAEWTNDGDARNAEEREADARNAGSGGPGLLADAEPGDAVDPAPAAPDPVAPDVID
jgi:DNA recombination protein RmuC